MALRTRTQRSLLLGFIASVSLCGLVGIYCLVIGQIGPFEEKILATTGIVSACATLGLAAGRCGLKFDIEIEEENSRKCGYPLYQIQSAVCPECGTPIASSANESLHSIGR